MKLTTTFLPKPVLSSLVATLLFLAALLVALPSMAQESEDVPVASEQEAETALGENEDSAELIQETKIVEPAEIVEPEPEPSPEVEVEETSPEEVSVNMKKVRRAESALEVMDDFDYSIKRLQNLSGRLSNKINDIEEAGVQLGTARNKMKQINNLIRNSFGELKKIKSQVNAAIANGKYEDGFVESSRSTLENIKRDGNAAFAEMKSVLDLMKKVSA